MKVDLVQADIGVTKWVAPAARSLEPRRSAMLISGLATHGDGLGPFLAACTPRFSYISIQFTVHLFSPWMPSSARGKGGGPRRFTAIVLNVSRRWFGGPAGVEPQSPGERNGRWSRLDSRVLREATCPHRG